MSNDKWKIYVLLLMPLALRSNVAFSRPDQRLLRSALHFNSDRAKLSVACFISWIITQTVLRPDLGRHPCKGRSCILQTRGQEIPSSAILRDLIHFASREIVEVATNLHFFELTHLTNIHKIFRSRAREEDLPVSL